MPRPVRPHTAPVAERAQPRVAQLGRGKLEVERARRRDDREEECLLALTAPPRHLGRHAGHDLTDLADVDAALLVVDAAASNQRRRLPPLEPTQRLRDSHVARVRLALAAVLGRDHAREHELAHVRLLRRAEVIAHLDQPDVALRERVAQVVRLLRRRLARRLRLAPIERERLLQLPCLGRLHHRLPLEPLPQLAARLFAALVLSARLRLRLGRRLRRARALLVECRAVRLELRLARLGHRE